jgi:hypothetical protein
VETRGGGIADYAEEDFVVRVHFWLTPIIIIVTMRVPVVVVAIVPQPVVKPFHPKLHREFFQEF